MAAGKMCNRKEACDEWTGLFINDLKTEDGSLLFIKRMMALTISSITYLRGIFPEDAYRSRYLEDLCIKVLRQDCSTPGASKVVKWMMGCFDALDKQYLQVVFIGVYTNPEEPNCIAESYNFKVRYTEKGPEMDILRNKDVKMQVTLEDTKKASVLLIRKLFLLMQNLDALPNNIYLTMKLYYYDNVTPADYEPPGFKEGTCENMWFEGTAVDFKVGDVKTNFHTLQVCVSAEQSRLEKLQEENQLWETKHVSQTEPPVSETVKDSWKTCAGDLPSEDESAQFQKPTKTWTKRKAAAKKQIRKKRRI